MMTRHRRFERPNLAVSLPSRRTLAATALLIVAGAAAVHTYAQAHRNKATGIRYWKLPPGVERITDVQFGEGGTRPLHLDIVRPKTQSPGLMPVILYIHGGGWRSGGKQHSPIFLGKLAAAGYFTVSIEYRLSREARFPAQIEDCKCAVRWLRAHARQYNLNSNRIGAWGHSAGGHLAALLGTTADRPELEGNGGWPGYSSRVQAVLDCCGPTDFTKMAAYPSLVDHTSAYSPEARLIGGPVQQRIDLARRASPITYIDRDLPPFLIMHGDRDRTVPLNQSEILYRALVSAGAKADLFVVKGGGHAFSGRQIDALTRAFFDANLRRTDHTIPRRALRTMSRRLP